MINIVAVKTKFLFSIKVATFWAPIFSFGVCRTKDTLVGYQIKFVLSLLVKGEDFYKVFIFCLSGNSEYY